MVSVNEQLSGHRVDSPFTCGGDRDVVQQDIAADGGKEREVHDAVRANPGIETMCAVVHVEYFSVDNLSETPLRRLRSVHDIENIVSLMNHGGGKFTASAEDRAVEAELLEERALVLYADIIACTAAPEAGKAHLPDRQSKRNNREPAAVNLNAK